MYIKYIFTYIAKKTKITLIIRVYMCELYMIIDTNIL